MAGQRSTYNQVRTELWSLVAPAVGTTTTVMATLSASSDAIVLTRNGVRGRGPDRAVRARRLSSAGFSNAPAVTRHVAAGQVVFGALVFKDGESVTPERRPRACGAPAIRTTGLAASAARLTVERCPL